MEYFAHFFRDSINGLVLINQLAKFNEITRKKENRTLIDKSVHNYYQDMCHFKIVFRNVF